ncbi:MAG: Holliday junction resolvase RecU [Eubacteriales bacterium]|nr:Holliday junction resolvase RecU [Eubacteriales bacterium]
MATWTSRGLRGSVLEEMVNHTNQRYRDMGLALIQKIPTPITPVRFDKNSRHITLAYFEKKSTVDYMGAVQGIPVCFDAKECAADVFPLQNIHEHQMNFMREYERQQGISFLLIYFTHRRECYYLRFAEMEIYWRRMKEGGQKHFKYSELSREYFVPSGRGASLHYLAAIQKDLQERNEKEKGENPGTF